MEQMVSGQVTTLLRELEFQDLTEQGATWKLDYGDGWVFVNKAMEMLWIENEGRTNAAGQLTISALLPPVFRAVASYEKAKHSSIKVKLSRGTGAIATAIVTRLLPGYRTKMDALRNRKAQLDREADERLEICRKLARAMKAPEPEFLMPLLECYSGGTEGKRLWVSVSPMWNGGCNLSFNGVPNELVERILHLLLEGRQRIER